MKKIDNRLLFTQIMEVFALNQSDMAKRIGIHQTNVSAIVRGERSCGDAIMTKVAKAFPEINKDWLLTGEGKMLADGYEEQSKLFVMEKTVKQRLMDFIEFRNLSVSKFESLCGLGNGYVGKLKSEPGSRRLEDILNVFPELNRAWLLYGEGEMLKSVPGVQQNNIHGDNHFIGGNYCGGRGVECVVPDEVRGAPIIPTSLSRAPNIDILEYISRKQSGVEMSNICIGGMPITLWHRVRDTSLVPHYRTGDLLGLWAYPKGEENPIPGKLYAVDTWSNGLIVRYLFPCDGGYRAHSPNSEEYPDFGIKGADVIRVYRVMIMVRM